ncbi:MAG: GNAT family N-acetyltransferase [Bacillota bacterium]|jgi:ribosomal protein S18 acetylase RimI-like enzyme
MNFRKMVLSDKTDFLNMNRKFFASPAVLHTVPEDFMDRNFEIMVADNNLAEGYIFEIDEEIVGYAFLTRNYSTEVGGVCLWIEEAFVEEEYRNRGIGRKFFSFLEDTYKDEVARIRMEVEPSNAGAIRLYEEIGFEKLNYVQMIKDF